MLNFLYHFVVVVLQMTVSLLSDHQDIQAFTIFSELLSLQEDGNDALKAELVLAKHYGYVCLCRLDILLTLKQQPPTHFLTSAIMTDQVKQYVTSEDKRGWEIAYLTLMQANNKVKAFKQEYKQLAESLQL